MRYRILTFALIAVLLFFGANVLWLYISGRLRDGAQEGGLKKSELTYVGRYRHGDLVTGANRLPFLPEASLEPEGRLTMTMVPSDWLAYSNGGDLLHRCSGSWQVGDDGDGSVMLEFVLTSIDGAKVKHFARARAMKDGFFFDHGQSYFLLVKNVEK